MDPAKFGTIVMEGNFEDNYRYAIASSPHTIQIDSTTSDDYKLINNVHYLQPTDLKFKDSKIDDHSFKREICKDTLYIRNNEVVYKEKQLNAKPFKIGKVDNKLTDPAVFCTIDIETVLLNGDQIPYLICGYINGKYIYEYASDNSEQAINIMFNNFLTKLLKFPKFKYVYAHNFSGFDGIFLLKHLLYFENSTVKPVIFNNKLMAVEFKYQENEDADPIVLKFKDSYLLLPMGLRELCKAFNVPTMKTHFPFEISNINYVGPFPDKQEYDNISNEDYGYIIDKWIEENPNSNDWNFKDEAIKYCKIDCKSLFEVLVKFNELIFNQFKVNVHGSLTLPALAMRIYKTQFIYFSILGYKRD